MDYMNPKIMVGSALLAGIVLTETIVFQPHQGQPAVVEQIPHLEVTIESAPLMIDVSSPGATGGRHTKVEVTDSFQFSDSAEISVRHIRSTHI